MIKLDLSAKHQFLACRLAHDFQDMGLSYIPIPDQDMRLAKQVVNNPEYQALPEDDQAALRKGECPQHDMRQQCNDWWSVSSVEAKLEQVQDAVQMALQHIGVAAS